MARNSVRCLNVAFLTIAAAAPIAPPPQRRPQPANAIEAQQTVQRPSSHYREIDREVRRVSVVDADYFCLDGFGLNQGTQRCEREEEKPADVGCPQGWEFADGACKTTAVTPADRYCQVGFEDMQGRCQRKLTAPKQLTCPPAYRASEFGCIKDVETAPSMSCDKGK